MPCAYTASSPELMDVEQTAQRGSEGTPAGTPFAGGDYRQRPNRSRSENLTRSPVGRARQWTVSSAWFVLHSGTMARPASSAVCVRHGYRRAEARAAIKAGKVPRRTPVRTWGRGRYYLRRVRAAHHAHSHGIRA